MVQTEREDAGAALVMKTVVELDCNVNFGYVAKLIDLIGDPGSLSRRFHRRPRRFFRVLRNLLDGCGRRKPQECTLLRAQ